MKDGDAQQQNENSERPERNIPSAVEVACGWHVGKNIDSSFHFHYAIPIFI